MSRVLKPHTIIPSHLYVKRAADYQIKKIINDMGRPGYILVARQMGKTNLLINAKRELQGSDDVFSYIDLSNRFDDARSCFRNIIDVILDSNYLVLGDAEQVILKTRQRGLLPAHKEHLREIKVILNSIKGKLVLFLDEIDSLTLADYSDKIFAQIRSIYFDRINSPAFERLTYVLSGVAEPSEIIKDRSISPFNIGQKIYLSDFTKTEHQQFITNSGLKIASEISDRIFYWTNGNPRLTWEISSEIEELIGNPEDVTEGVVDDLVKFLYLNTYDKPPIDHIRNLIKSNKDMRQAVISINYGRSDTISDDLKAKLYLSGILGSDYELGEVKIKNRVIEACLNDEWLNEIDETSSVVSSISKADAYFLDELYEKAIQVYLAILEEADLEEPEFKHVNFRLGAAYFKEEKYDEVIEVFSKGMYEKEHHKALYFEQVYLLGLSCLRTGMLPEARSYFQEIIAEGRSCEYYFPSNLMMSVTLSSLGGESDYGEIRRLCEYVISSVSAENSNKWMLIAATYQTLAMFEQGLGDNKSAFDNYIKASEFEIKEGRIKPLISALKISESEVGGGIYSKIINEIIVSSFTIGNVGSEYDLVFSEDVLGELILIGIEREYFTDLNKLIDYSADNMFSDKYKFSEFLSDLSGSHLSNAAAGVSKVLLNYIFGMNRKNVKPEVYFENSKYLYLLDPSHSAARECYIKGIQNYIKKLDVVDSLLMDRSISWYQDVNAKSKAVSFSEMILNTYKSNDHAQIIFLIPIMAKKLQLITDPIIRIEYAKDFKAILNKISASDLESTYITNEVFKKIKISAVRASKGGAVEDYFVPQIVKRNDVVTVQYLTGKVVNGKYKKLSNDIDDGLCSII